MGSMSIRHMLNTTCCSYRINSLLPSLLANKSSSVFTTKSDNSIIHFISLNNAELSSKGKYHLIPALSKPPSARAGNGASPTDDNEDGVSLGTMKLPLDTDLARFETLLFQWANSLCQGANLPLPVPLKVDKIAGGCRLGFITVGDGETQVLVYIDCLVFPATKNDGPIFRAIRNGPAKDQAPPGEPRIMRSLLDALRKSVEIARL